MTDQPQDAVAEARKSHAVSVPRKRPFATRKSPNARDRFDARWIPEPNTGCWLWMGFVAPDGYGMFHETRTYVPQRAHRSSWRFYRGEIPDGMVIDHICRVRSCVNPDHLRVATLHQNAIENSESVTAKHAAKDTCVNGHPLYGDNVRVVVMPKHGVKRGRRCRACNRERMRNVRAERALRALDAGAMTEAQKDTQRLDFLERTKRKAWSGEGLRAAIDAAMENQK